MRSASRSSRGGRQDDDARRGHAGRAAARRSPRSAWHDFVITAFLSADASTKKIPVKIYANARGAPTPALNALASVRLFLMLVAAALFLLVYRLVQGRQGGKGFGDIAGLRA